MLSDGYLASSLMSYLKMICMSISESRQLQRQIRFGEGLKENGIELYLDAPTNQVFCVVDNAFMEKLAQKVEFSFWEKKDETHTVIRFATSWATTMEDVDELIRWIEQKKNRN